MNTVIKKGYRLTVSSWENDGDYQQDRTFDGLSREKVAAIINLLSLFSSRSNFSNMYDPSSSELKAAGDALSSLFRSKGYDQLFDEYEVDLIFKEPTVFIGQFLGYSEGYSYRVFDDFKVEYLPADIIIEDVTTQFKESE